MSESQSPLPVKVLTGSRLYRLMDWPPLRRLRPAAERLAVATLVLTLTGSYFILAGGKIGQPLLAPPLVALLLVANLIPAITLVVLGARRFARKRAIRAGAGEEGGLHVRLVSVFSATAAIPVLLLVIFASLLFQFGVDFWYSQKARGIFENASALATNYYSEKQSTIIKQTEVMASDIGYNLGIAPIESADFASSFGFQVFQRELSEGAILRISPKNGVQSLAIVNPYNRPADNWVPADVASALLTKGQTVFRDTGDRMEAVTPVPGHKDLFLYASRVDNSAALAQTKRFTAVLNDYNSLVDRSRTLQLQFHAALFLVALLIVGAAIFFALMVADRLIQPVTALVQAAQKIADGDLSVRVPPMGTRDEVAELALAFNQMTARLDEQRRELVGANALLDRRRSLIEAVFSGVSAGVIAIDARNQVRMLNASAATLLGIDGDNAPGKPLSALSAELDAMVSSRDVEGHLQIERKKDTRTLAVRILADSFGHVITFDDITQQLSDQRRAAWSDVGRRVAHEIKNPLTPIQLAAERIKRRFGRGENEDSAIALKLSDTIIRQVGDLRRMVDEFSAFARMPKPEFAEDSLEDICRQTLFLYEVAHSDIRFSMTCEEGFPPLLCDRRQLGQAMTNVIKNAVEAIEQKVARDGPGDHAVQIIVSAADGMQQVQVEDSGIGLPAEREKIVEPYMTTRAAGTGLGLAIVKRIVEDHGGVISFADRPGGGAMVTFTLAAQPQTPNIDHEAAPRLLTRMED